MKKNLATICSALMILLLSTGPALAGNGKAGNFSQTKGGGLNTGIAQLAYEEPAPEEIAALTYMVEEEKLARDVYNVLYDTWNIPVFANIVQAEQRHMDAIISLLDKYGLDNPAVLEPGLFVNPDLQTLYANLITAGQTSEEEALLVGATIEDVDIFDLLRELEQVDNEDITKVFENLLQGSENHLRAFSTLLAVYGYEPYEAQFLSQEQIDEILSTPPSRGGKGNGSAKAQANRQMLDADGDGICDFLQQ